MWTEGDMFVEKTIFDGDGTLGALLTSNTTWINAPLADLYGVPAPTGDGFTQTALDPTQRGGILTLSGFLASHAHPVDPSPVLRGVFILDRMLCAPPPPPPPNVPLTPPTAEPGVRTTNRQRFDEHAKSPVCAGCHTRIDGVGFPYESFDSLGHFRTQDNGVPVDPTGQLMGAGASDGPVANAIDLGHKLASSDAVLRCAAKQWFRYAYGRTELEGDAPALSALGDAFLAKKGDIRELLVAIVMQPGFSTLVRGK
jgi:hypothetical protein